eukprot:TRINITY_DN35505_c0_g1_i1.p1 TRINITY_DN35505_c0_g1~~TRINITY_DN35505_c0_g1_i1.p1  ORF type:complete len:740 (-),score=176.05 TRINITY_DN35505_c0_g1_i1:736-2955(-)
MTSFSALITSLVTSFIIFLIIFFAYAFLSKKDGLRMIYFPARVLAGHLKGEAHKGGGMFHWLLADFQTSEMELALFAGLDAAVFIRFQRTCLWILLSAGVYCLPILIPVCASDTYLVDYNSVQTDPLKKISFDSFDKLAMGNITPKSARLWGGALGLWWVSLCTYFLLYRTYATVVHLRAALFSASREGTALPAGPETFCALVRDLPNGNGDEATRFVRDFFAQIYGGAFRGAMLVPKLRKVTRKAAKLTALRKKLAHAEGAFARSKTEECPEGKAPTTKTGLCGLVGTPVDTQTYLREQIEELEMKLRKRQEVALEGRGKAAFLFFTTRQAAAAAAQTFHAEQGNHWNVMRAPEPRDVEWGNLRMRSTQRIIRSGIVFVLVFLMIVFYMIPISFISSLSTLENIQKLLPFLKSVNNISALKTVLEAYLPQLALIVFLALLPGILITLSTAEGLPSKSHISRAASGKYFYFIIFNVFLGVTLSASLFSTIKQITKSKPTYIVDLLANSLPTQSTFFITYVSLKFLIGDALELSRLVPLVMWWAKKRFLCTTVKEEEEAWAPGPVDYVKHVPQDLLIVTLGLCYAVIAPMILPFTILYFVFNWAIMKNQVLNVYRAEWESHGRMWPHMHNRILAALILSQITCLGYFGIKKFVGAVVLLPLPLLSGVYYFYAKGCFYRSFEMQSLEVASRDHGQPLLSDEVLLSTYMSEAMLPVERVGVLEDDERLALLLEKGTEKDLEA